MDVMCCPHQQPFLLIFEYMVTPLIVSSIFIKCKQALVHDFPFWSPILKWDPPVPSPGLKMHVDVTFESEITNKKC